MLYINIVMISGSIGITECELILEAWLNGMPYGEEQKVIKLPTYGFAETSKTIKIGDLKVKLTWNPIMGVQGFTGTVVKPINKRDIRVVINDTNWR